MRMKLKGFIAITLVSLMVTSQMAYAAENKDKQAQSSKNATEEMYITGKEAGDGVYDTSAHVCTTGQEVLEVMVSAALKDEEKIRIYMTEEAYDELDKMNYEYGYDLVTAASKYVDSPDTSKDGEYFSYWVSLAFDDGRFDFHEEEHTVSRYLWLSYDLSKVQDKKLDDKIASILKSLKLDKKSDYDKVKAIHDYVIKNANYGGSNHTLNAYGVLIDKKGVCQSYALAAYRLFNDAGIECKMIGANTHVWNLVKVDGKWYYIDLTWDDEKTKSNSNICYTYFLKGSKDFTDHASYTKGYNNADKKLIKELPLSSTGYKKK